MKKSGNQLMAINAVSSSEKYIKLYEDAYRECLKAAILDPGNTDHCIALGAQSSLAKLSQDFANRGSNCGLSSYVAIVVREADLPSTSSEIAELLYQNTAKKAIGHMQKFIENYAVPLSGCAIGGAITAGGGAILGFTYGGWVGAGLGAAISFPQGCAAGATLATEIYIVNEGVHKLKETYETAKTIGVIVQNIWSSWHEHYIDCNPQVRNQITLSDSIRLPLLIGGQTPIIWKKNLNQETIKIFELPEAKSLTLKKPSSEELSPIPLRPEVVTTPLPPLKNLSSPSPDNHLDFVCTIDDVAKKLIDMAGDFTGVTSLMHEAKDLKEVLVTLLSDGANGPERFLKKIIDKSLLQNPEKMFERMINTPEKFMSEIGALSNSHTALNALGNMVSVVGTVFGVIQELNTILPILTKVSEAAFKNPLNVPVVLTKELWNLTTMKVVGVVKTIEGLCTKPVETLKNMGKGMANSPKLLIKNVKNLFGHSRRKYKRAKRKAKEMVALQVAAEQKLVMEQKIEQQNVILAVSLCYKMALSQWMIPESKTLEEYFLTLLEDWKKFSSTGGFKGKFSTFIQKVHGFLNNGQITEVVRISSAAHLSQQTPPSIFFHTLKEFAVSSSKLICQIHTNHQRVEELQHYVNRMIESAEAGVICKNSFEGIVQDITTGPSLVMINNDMQTTIEQARQENALVRNEIATIGNSLNISAEEAADLLQYYEG